MTDRKRNGLLQKFLGFNKEPLRPIVPLKEIKLYPEIFAAKEKVTDELLITIRSESAKFTIN